MMFEDYQLCPAVAGSCSQCKKYRADFLAWLKARATVEWLGVE